MHPAVFRLKLNNVCCLAQNGHFVETGSCFMEKMSSGCLSDVLRHQKAVSTLWFTEVPESSMWAACRLKLQLQQRGVLVFCPAIRGGLALWKMEVQRQNGHQNQSRVSGKCHWTEQPRLTSWQRRGRCKETLMKKRDSERARGAERVLSDWWKSHRNEFLHKVVLTSFEYGSDDGSGDPLAPKHSGDTTPPGTSSLYNHTLSVLLEGHSGIIKSCNYKPVQ